MSDLEDSFLQAIARQPHDWLPRLIFADWLEEQGDPCGELIRLSQQLTQLDCEYRQQMEARLQELSAAGVLWPSPTFPNSLDMKFVLIPPGQIRMGSPPEEKGRRNNETQVDVTLSRGFYLGQHAVAQAEWKAVMGTSPWEGKTHVKDGCSYPATYISWNDASEFCVKLAVQGHREDWLPKDWQMGLPTEAQWEYACRAGTESGYSFRQDDSTLGQYAWFEENADKIGEQYAHQVGLKKPNPWGLHDMHGNVWEWCRDWYGAKLPGGTDPEVQARASFRVDRGGSWRSSGWVCRSALRYWDSPDLRSNDLGFRLALIQVR